MRVYYGGRFQHLPVFSYSSETHKTYADVDLEGLSVEDLEAKIHTKLPTFGSLYYKRRVCGIRLLCDSTMAEMVELSRSDYVCELFEYRPNLPDWDDGNDNLSIENDSDNDLDENDNVM